MSQVFNSQEFVLTEDSSILIDQYNNTMVRTPQKAELLSLEEIAAIKQQLLDAVRLCEEAERVASDKKISGFFVLHKPAILRAVESLRRVQTSLYQTINATRLGRPLSSGSLTPGGARVAKAKAQVLEVKNKLHKKD
jgi:hypothetical protein